MSPGSVAWKRLGSARRDKTGWYDNDSSRHCSISQLRFDMDGVLGLQCTSWESE